VLFIGLTFRDFFTENQTKTKTNSALIQISFCISWGYSRVFDELSELLRSRGIDSIIGETYSAGFVRNRLANLVSLVKFALLISIVMNIDLSINLFGINSWYTWCLEHKAHSLLIIWLFGNWIETALLSTGAFEIHCKGSLIWSKLKTGRIPQTQELLNRIEKCLQTTSH